MYVMRETSTRLENTLTTQVQGGVSIPHVIANSPLEDLAIAADIKVQAYQLLCDR